MVCLFWHRTTTQKGFGSAIDSEETSDNQVEAEGEHRWVAYVLSSAHYAANFPGGEQIYVGSGG